MIEAKTFRKIIRTYALFKSECLNASIKINLHKVLIRTVMTYTSPVWQLAAGIHLMKFQRLQNKVLRASKNFPKCTPVRDLHTAFNLPHAYDYRTKLFRQQAEVVQNHENEHVRSTEQGEARQRKYKRLKFGGG
jgi:hypothetical protein